MIKLYVFLTAAPGTDPFRHRGAAALGELHRVAPTAVEYVQTRASERQLSDEPPPFAGAAEFRFDYAAPAVEAAADVAKLANLWADGAVVAKVVAGHERTIMRLPSHAHGQGVKGVFPFDRKAGLSVDYFQQYWWRTHGPIAAQTEGALAYFQCHPLRHLYEDGRPRLRRRHRTALAGLRRRRSRHGLTANARGPVPGCPELCRNRLRAAVPGRGGGGAALAGGAAGLGAAPKVPSAQTTTPRPAWG